MENFDLIERYLLGKMTAGEKAAFEERLEKEPDLQTEKDTMADLILGVESLGLKNKLKGRKIGEEANGKVVKMEPKRKFSFQKLAIAASVAAVFFCGWWFLNPGLNEDDQLYSSAFVTDPGLPTRMSETENYNFYDAMVEYKMENYDKAIEEWTKSPKNIGKDTLDYYLGMAYLNKGDYSKAEEMLTGVKDDSALSSKAQWYLLSILIKEKKYSEAKQMLKELPSTIHPGYDDVSKYLEKK